VLRLNIFSGSPGLAPDTVNGARRGLAGADGNALTGPGVEGGAPLLEVLRFGVVGGVFSTSLAAGAPGLDGDASGAGVGIDGIAGELPGGDVVLPGMDTESCVVAASGIIEGPVPVTALFI
jgi:hypothetical protein